MDTVTINITETPNEVTANIIEAVTNVTINVTVGGGGMQCADLAACQTIIDIEADINTVSSDLNAHETNTSNPHNVTKSQVGLSNVDNTSDINKPVSTAQQTALNLKEDKSNKVTNFTSPNNTDYATTQATINLVDNRVQSNIKIIGDWDATSGSYPLDDESNTTPFITQWGSTIKAGWAFRVGYGQAGAVGGFDYENGDVVYALVDNATNSSADWGDLDHNLQQADESLRGTAKIVTAVIISDETSTDDERIVTTKKLWLNFWTRVLAIAHTFAAKITFTTAPRFNSVTASQYLKVDASKDLTSVSAIPATDVTEDSTHRFITDTQLTNLGNQSGINTGDNATNTQYSGLAANKENTSNKVTTFTGNESSITLFPVVKAIVDYLVANYQPKKFSYIDTTNGALSSGASNTLSKSVLIPANTLTSGLLNIKGRSIKTGTASFGWLNIYVNTVNSMSGAVQIGQMNNASNNTVLNWSIERNIPIKSGSFTAFIVNSTVGSENVITNNISTVTIDWTVDQYIILAVQANSGAESLRANFFSVNQF